MPLSLQEKQLQKAVFQQISGKVMFDLSKIF